MCVIHYDSLHLTSRVGIIISICDQRVISLLNPHTPPQLESSLKLCCLSKHDAYPLSVIPVRALRCGRCPLFLTVHL